MPFWWWAGEPLDQERLAWQLDALARGGVKAAVIGYPHFPDGRNDPGEPAVFSEPWWALLRWLVAECRARGMILGFQDYTLINPLLAEIGRETPGMAGGELREAHALARAGAPADLACPAGNRLLAAAAYPASPDGLIRGPALCLTDRMREGRLRWEPDSGTWLASLVWCRPAPFDPMHPQAGPRLIERLYAPFEQRLPGELGKTLGIFFQDELDFGIRMPMWSDSLPEAFAAAKGYALAENLPALWHPIGPSAPKIRVDYADTVTRLLEASYFIPVFRWHEERGILFGNDNAGRGAIGTGRRYYGDAFRTLRWYSAPGTDDPQLDGPRAFQGLKVNSSIAQLYGRPRVWVEAFHSSGWGASPAQIVAGLNEDFLLGANVVNLHGLYYTTFGSWWEWAAPDFHFRQPYWTHARPMNDYLARLCALLSQGVHVCDTALLYPITAIEGGLNRGRGAGAAPPPSLSERQRGEEEPPLDPAEAIAFRLGRALLDAGENFDFVDFESVERARCRGAALAVAGGSYRALVLPMMSTIRFGVLRQAREFYLGGGCVVAVGCLPQASDRIGAEDPQVGELLAELFGSAPAPGQTPRGNGAGGCAAFVSGVGEALRVLRSRGRPDFEPAGAPLQAMHRRIGGREVYFVRNPLDGAVAASGVFRARGRAELWDAWTGHVSPLAAAAASPEAARIPLELAAGEAKLVVFDPSQPEDVSPPAPAPPARVVLELPSEGWAFELDPTRDNRHGDFRRPPSPEKLGAEAWTFRHREERADGGDAPEATVTATYGPRFWKLGPLPPAAGPALEVALRGLACVEARVPVVVAGREHFWEPYAFSREWGIERDPFLLDWRSGPHGLKKRVPDEFIDLEGGRPGSVWYLWSSLQSPAGGEAPLVAGSRAAFAVWLNGDPVLARELPLPAGLHPAWNLPYYESEPLRAAVRLRAGDNPLLVRLRQPSDQRLRAYVAIEGPPAPEDRPALRWFADVPAWTFNPRPREREHPGRYRFLAPPGADSFRVRVRGVLSASREGRPLEAEPPRPLPGGIWEYAVTISPPSSDPAEIVLRLQPSPDAFGGDALAGPVSLRCRPGRISLGDWSGQGLAAYSGAAWYRRELDLPGAETRGAWTLDLGDVRASAEVWWNGARAGVRVAPPWTFDVTPFVAAGSNRLEVRVANTLSNHYGAGIPTPYFFPEQSVSGLLGPVRISRR